MWSMKATHMKARKYSIKLAGRGLMLRTANASPWVSTVDGYTSGYPWSDLIRLNIFSYELSLIGIFLCAVSGANVFVPGQNMGWSFWRWSSMVDVPFEGPFFWDESYLAWDKCFDLDYLTGDMHVTRCLEAVWGVTRDKLSCLLYRIVVLKKPCLEDIFQE